jgi:outer membrane beta-barrel protein
VTLASPRRAALTALLLLAAARPLPGRAANKADAFEGKIQPISGQLYGKAGRLELTLLGATSLDDAFHKKYFGTLRAGWHFSEFLAASLSFSTGVTARTGSDTVCPANQGCRPASTAELYQVPGRLRSLASAEVAWTPVYGKLNLVAEQVAHFDLGLLLGVDWIAHDQVLSSNQALVQHLTPGAASTVGGHVGLGVRLFLTEAVALRWEFKDYVYTVKVPNLEQSGRSGGDVQNQLLTELGVSVFFPLQGRMGGRAP